MKLNLGCGNDYKAGFVNIDIAEVKKDLYLDLNKYPYPYEENSIDFINARAILEHLDEPIKFMRESYRILKPQGKLEFRVPLAGTHIDNGDLTHKNHFLPKSFNMFFRENLFSGDIWITIPFFHQFKFPNKLFWLNSIINNIFTGINGILTKE